MSNTRSPKKPPAKPSLTIDDLIEMAAPLERTVYICVNGALQGDYDEAEHVLYEAAQVWEAERRAVQAQPQTMASIGVSQGTDDAVLTAGKALDAIKDAMQEHVHAFRFKSFPGGASAYHAKRAEYETGGVIEDPISHEPIVTDDGGTIPAYDLDRFLPDVMAECLVAIDGDKQSIGAAKARQFIDALGNESSKYAIVQTIAAASTGAVTAIPFSQASSPARTPPRRSPTFAPPVTLASPQPSTPDESSAPATSPMPPALS